MKMNYIDETAVIGAGCVIGNFVNIEAGCVLGDRVTIHNNVTIYPGTRIGDDTEIFDGAVIGRPPKSNGHMIHKIAADFQPTLIGKGCVIGANVVVYAQCVLGDAVLLGDGVKMREGVFVGDRALVAMNCTINHDAVLQSGVKIMDLSHLTANMLLEENAFVGVGISTANDRIMRMSGQEVGKSTQIVVGKGSRVGSAVMILPSVTIGKDAFVGASALVTKDVPDGVRVMGIPAKEK